MFLKDSPESKYKRVASKLHNLKQFTGQLETDLMELRKDLNARNLFYRILPVYFRLLR
jgi:hypothetical protein